MVISLTDWSVNIAMEAPVKRKDIPPQRRQQIFDAAAELFSQSGYHGVTVDSIAQRAGISKGNLYWYFRSKQEIFRLLLEQATEKFFGPVAETLDSDTAPREKLLALSRTCLEAAEANPEAVHLLWQIATQPELKGLLASEFQLRVDSFIGYLTTLFAEIGEGDPEGVAMLYAFTLDALMFLVLVSPGVYDKKKLTRALEEKFLGREGGSDA
jgi:AcrR family transcriptional regulator